MTRRGAVALPLLRTRLLGDDFMLVFLRLLQKDVHAQKRRMKVCLLVIVS
jgi:hypothetical protein